MSRGIQLGVMGAVLLGAATGSVRAEDAQPGRHRAAPSEIRDCWHLLDDLGGFSVPVEGAPGLRILRTELLGLESRYDVLVNGQGREAKRFHNIIHSHEVAGSANYARLVAAEGETVVLVSTLASTPVPGFDGVIFDRDGGAAANYSLKSVFHEHHLHAVEEAIRKASKYSRIREWGEIMKAMRGHFLGLEDAAVKEVPAGIWAKNVFKIFGLRPHPNTGRPTRVVIDIAPSASVEFPSESEQARLREQLRGTHGLVESIIYLKGQQYLIILPD